ncbi:MAG: AbrB/MazE/SpoVT family DNA-binding domain-containing protein [Anaerolineae bacterium]|nr:AbrB/MazE/SpoVT family DNA-binding domain-containing protein [Anaerolineae bacterium]
MVDAIYEVNVDAEGKLTLPAELRESLGLQADDTLKIVQTGEHVLLIPKRLLVPEFAGYMSQLLADKGLTVDNLLASGEDIRDELFQERYGDLAG